MPVVRAHTRKNGAVVRAHPRRSGLSPNDMRQAEHYWIKVKLMGLNNINTLKAAVKREYPRISSSQMEFLVDNERGSR